MRCLALLIALVVCTQPALSDGDAELKVEIVKSSDSCSRKSKKGDILSMHYTGTLVDGKEFDSSRQRGEPFRFQIGLGQAGAGDRIPPGATLVFETELTKIEDGPPPVNVFKQIDSDQDEQLTREEISKYLKEQLPAAQAAGLKDLPDTDKMVEEIFQHEDKDRDGVISREEFSGPKHDEL
ncbi:hypothetical protein MRX96_008245 [Rhipicephalus microplus]